MYKILKFAFGLETMRKTQNLIDFASSEVGWHQLSLWAFQTSIHEQSGWKHGANYVNEWITFQISANETEISLGFAKAFWYKTWTFNGLQQNSCLICWLSIR
jgi:hypothetical protein